jgi:hypothetical protein
MAYVPVDIPVAPGTMLSDGTINATIHTYKPPSISIPCTISIIHEDDIIATIHVEDNPDSTPMYKLSGNSRSLQLFKMLCNIDITDKSPYLMFNGEAATLPKGFEVTQPDGTKFILPAPPMNKASNKFVMESMMEAVEEVARQPAGSGAADRPPNTIFLLVSMHGARLETMPLSMDLPINETYAYAPGECPKLKVSTILQLERIQKYRGLDDSLDGYAKDVPVAEKHKIGRYSVLYDQHYQCDVLNNANVFSNGIFILGSNFLDKAVLNPIEFEGERMPVEYPQFSTALYEQTSAMELQKINLINIEVLEKLSRLVTGDSFALEHTSPDPYFSRKKNDTGLPHYFDSKLSHYLRYCQKLGAEKVVVIDETCRIRSFRQGVAAEEREAAEELGPGKLISTPYAPGAMRDTKSDYGGRRTKRRRTRRSRRSHKKS